MKSSLRPGNFLDRKAGDHFMVCPGCLARIDVRNLTEVLKHMHPDQANEPGLASKPAFQPTRT